MKLPELLKYKSYKHALLRAEGKGMAVIDSDAEGITYIVDRKDKNHMIMRIGEQLVYMHITQLYAIEKEAMQVLMECANGREPYNPEVWHPKKEERSEDNLYTV